jgi:hypothetical protein
MFKADPDEHPFHPRTFFTPAIAGIVRRGLTTPMLALDAIRAYLHQSEDLTLAESMLRLSGALPVGIFDNEPIRTYLAKIYSLKNRTDDFRKLQSRLIVVATELDSGRAVRFGAPGHDHVPISQAVQASAALPGLYPPVRIDGRDHVDGVLLKTLHASVALDAGARLVICVNPIVPVNTTNGTEPSNARRLTDLGLPTVLSQTFRTLIHSRMNVGLAAYPPRYPGRDIVLIEPKADDQRMFFTNIFSLSSRKAVCAYAYEVTRQDLRARYDELAPLFARHGLRLRRDVLDDSRRDLWSGVGLDGSGRHPDVCEFPAVQRLGRALDALERELDAAERPRRRTRVTSASRRRRRA